MKKFKAILLSILLSASAFSMTAFAEKETTAEKAETTKAETTISQDAADVTETTTEVTVPHQSESGGGSVIINSETIGSENFYNEILDYVGEDKADNLNDNLKNNALTINSTTIDYSDKSMFTVTTRSGDVFYLIINNSDGSCLFLNAVDTADLTSMLNKNDNSESVNNDAIEEIENMEKEEVNQEAVTTNTENYKSDSSTENATTSDATEKKTESMLNNILWIGIAIVGAVIVALAAALIKKKKGSNNSYDDAFDNDFNMPTENNEAEPYSEEE